jgi:hypothetical protein
MSQHTYYRGGSYTDYVYKEDIEDVREYLSGLVSNIRQITGLINPDNIEQFNNTPPTLALKYGEECISDPGYDGEMKATQWSLDCDTVTVELCFKCEYADSLANYATWAWAWAISILIPDRDYIHMSSYNSHPYINLNFDGIGIDFFNTDGSTHDWLDHRQEHNVFDVIEFVLTRLDKYMLTPIH